jgi:hypothetical protein
MIPSHPLWTDFKTSTNEKQIKDIAKELFHVPNNDAWRDGNLDELRLNLFARIVEADYEVVKRYGKKCLIHRFLVEKARLHGVTPAVLKSWGSKAKDGFKTRNKGAEFLTSGSTVADRVEAKTDVIIDQIEVLNNTTNSTEDKIDILHVSNTNFYRLNFEMQICKYIFDHLTLCHNCFFSEYDNRTYTSCA